MKTLIFNGSPRKNGDTAALITSFLRETAGYPDDTYKIVTAYDAGIQPCRDCRCLSGRAGTDYCRGGAMYQSSKPLPSAFTDVPNMYRPSADMYSMTPPGMMIP